LDAHSSFIEGSHTTKNTAYGKTWNSFSEGDETAGILIFFVLENTLLGVYTTQLSWHIPWEGGWDTGVGWSSSIEPKSGILSEKPLASKAGWKKFNKK
jgi:hypothetical protein